MGSNFMELGQEVAVAFYQPVGRRKWRKPQALAERRAQAEAAEATSPRGAHGESSKLQRFSQARRDAIHESSTTGHSKLMCYSPDGADL